MTVPRSGQRLWAVRHAPTASSGLCVGRFDVPVSIDPATAASQLQQTYPSQQSVSRIWTSPSLRCLNLASELANRTGADITIDERLWEISYGRWEGRSWRDLEQSENAFFLSWMQNWQNVAPPEGESVAMLEARVRAWWQSLTSTCNHWLIGHAGVMKALGVIVEAMSWEVAMAMPVEHLKWRSY